MKQRSVLFLCLLSTLIFYASTSALAQRDILDNNEWYRPDYAKANVDTVKVRFGEPIEHLPYSNEVVIVYNQYGNITYYGNPKVVNKQATGIGKIAPK